MIKTYAILLMQTTIIAYSRLISHWANEKTLDSGKSNMLNLSNISHGYYLKIETSSGLARKTLLTIDSKKLTAITPQSIPVFSDQVVDHIHYNLSLHSKAV
jgi:hypothetical protein